MCGIIGYTGNGNAVAKVTKGLKILEYRGYDSAGIAALTENGLSVIKCGGRINTLEEKINDRGLNKSSCAIGHTRWATHGSPSDKNAHPHRVGKTVLVHNGIIENYREIKEKLQSDYTFVSETDTEAAAALIDQKYAKLSSPVDALRMACAEMTGSYAFAIMFEDRPSEVFAVRRSSPLIIAKGTDGFYLASDMTALIPFTDQYCSLEEGAIAMLCGSTAEIVGEHGETDPVWQKSTMTADEAEKGGYAHFMEKEMLEEPDSIIRAVSPRIKNGLPDFSEDGINMDYWRDVEKIRIVACGSAMHAGLLGIHMFSRLAGTECEVSIASEYRYYPPNDGNNTLVVPISQSGETADTLAALRYAKGCGLKTLSIVNAVESTIARESDKRLYTYAGPEIAVATTKGYCTQIALLNVIAAAIGLAKGFIDEKTARSEMLTLTSDAPNAMRRIFENRQRISQIAEKIHQSEHVFFIGRGPDYALAEEGALKLKEISYIHAEAYAAGELKHGTISLIEENTPVISLSAWNKTADKTESNIREVKSRGGYVISVSPESENSSADENIALSASSSSGALFGSLAALQMLAYETAILRGCDIDKPRNLAKSVTVE